MSTDELVNAYIEGSVSRRTFIRRLVGAGVSLGAAVSYAHLLTPQRAGAQTGPDFYNPDFYRPPQIQLSFPSSQDLEDLSKTGVIEVVITTQEPAQFQLLALATASGGPKGGAAESAKKRKRKKRGPVTIATLVVDLPTAGQRLIQVPLTPAGLKLIRRAKKVSLVVNATATDRQRSVTTATAQQVLRGGRKRKKRK